MTRVVVARRRDDGSIEAGVFLVDVFCLGIKDSFLTEASAVDWPDVLNRMLPVNERLALHPACARKFVEGAVAYAQALGFAPHHDYKKARRAFGSVSASECPEAFTYGENGKPLFIAGPNDDGDRIERVLRVLTAKLGPKGFDYILPVDPHLDDDDDDDVDGYDAVDASLDGELIEFFDLLDRKTDRYVLGGICTAVCLCVPEVDPEDLIPILWDGNPPSAWNHDTESLGGMIVEYLHEIDDRIAFAKDNDEPQLIPQFAYEPWKLDAELIERARAWCRGFVRVVQAWPEAWTGALDLAVLRSSVGLIATIAEEGVATLGPKPIPAKDLPRLIGNALLAIRAVLPLDEDPGAGLSDQTSL